MNENSKKIKYRRYSLKELYNYKTFDRAKFEEEEEKPSTHNITNTKISQTQKFIRIDNKINAESSNNNRISHQIYKSTTHKINSDEINNIYYNNITNYSYNYAGNDMSKDWQYKKT